jgi:hypothetical protein
MTAASDTVEAVSRRGEASRKNGSKSRGPTTPEGKARSCLNALKHGLTAKTLVLPGESQEQLQEFIQRFKADLHPQCDTEEYFAQRAAIAAWELDRADRVIAARLNERVRYGLLDLEEAEADEVEDNARRLFWDPRGPIALYPHWRSFRVTRISSPDSVDDPLNPARLVNRLEHLAAGCQWLIDRWTDLRNLLEDGLKWQAPDRLKAIRMLGRQPMDLLADERVLMIYLACDAMDPDGPTSLDDMRVETNDLEQARIKERVQGRGADRKKPADPEAGKAVLLALIERAASRLEVKLSAHRERKEFEKAMQRDLLAFDESAEGELIRRYQLGKDRQVHRAINALIKVRREGRTLAEGEWPLGGSVDGEADPLSAALEASIDLGVIPVAGPESLAWVSPTDSSGGEPEVPSAGSVQLTDATLAESVGCAELSSKSPTLQEPVPADETNPSPPEDPSDETNPNPPEPPLPAAGGPSLSDYVAAALARQDLSQPLRRMALDTLRELERPPMT